MIMKSLDRFQFLANVLIVACARPNAEVGKLVKALVTYATEGTRTDLGDLRLEAYFDLIAQDLDSQRMAAEKKSRKCSESAKCRTARNNGSANSPAKKANVANATNVANSSNATTAESKAIEEMPTEPSDANTSNDVRIAEESKDFNASDVTSSFDIMKKCYEKIGDNESQAFGVWQQLSEDERTSAFAYAQRLQGDLSSRTYLYVYLRDREWTKATSPVNR
jgi:hypothetical protein